MGRIGRPHGVKGEISATWFGDNPLPKGAPIYFAKGGGEFAPMAVATARRHKEKLLLTLEGVTDRDAAEALNGKDIYLARDDLPPLEEDEAYVADLMGCQIFMPDNSLAGVLDHFEFPAGQEIWVIRQEDGSEALFPARPEFIKEIDLEGRRVIINPPQGLLEIYNA